MHEGTRTRHPSSCHWCSVLSTWTDSQAPGEALLVSLIKLQVSTDSEEKTLQWPSEYTKPIHPCEYSSSYSGGSDPVGAL